MVLFTLLISMIVVLFLVNKKVNMGLALSAGAILLSLFNGRSIVHIIKVFAYAIVDDKTIGLAATVALISSLGYIMDKFNILNNMIDALEKILRSAKITILFAPAIIGTLLVTGGALMSCPVVDKLGEKLEISKDKRAALNMVFRHALYFIFPLSTTMILAAEIGEFDLLDFIKLQFPISVALYVLGYIFLLKGAASRKVEKITFKEYSKSLVKFVIYASPILISVFGVLLFKLPFYISLLFGIVCSFIVAIYEGRKKSIKVFEDNPLRIIVKGIKPKMVAAIFGIMIFKEVVSDIDEISNQLYALLDKSIPVELVIIIACFIVCFSVASVQPGIAVLFPVILPLAPNYEMKLLYAMFIYTNAFIFYYISPLHLCQVLTLEYFDVKLKELYKNYLVILPITYLVMLVIYFMH